METGQWEEKRRSGDAIVMWNAPFDQRTEGGGGKRGRRRLLPAPITRGDHDRVRPLVGRAAPAEAPPGPPRGRAAVPPLTRPALPKPPGAPPPGRGPRTPPCGRAPHVGPAGGRRGSGSGPQGSTRRTGRNFNGAGPQGRTGPPAGTGAASPRRTGPGTERAGARTGPGRARGRGTVQRSGATPARRAGARAVQGPGCRATARGAVQRAGALHGLWGPARQGWGARGGYGIRDSTRVSWRAPSHR